MAAKGDGDTNWKSIWIPHPGKKRRGFGISEKHLPLFHDLELIRGEDFLDLAAGVGGAGRYGFEFGVAPPVAQSLARLTCLLKGQGQVVMGVGIGGSQGDGGLVSADAVGQASSLVEHVAEIEVRQRVLEINLDSFAVITLSQHIIVTVVVERAQVDVSSGMRRIELDALLVGRDGFILRGGRLFQADAAGEKISCSLCYAHGVN